MDTVFDVSRSIYEKDFQKINTVYKEKAIPAELGVVIGAMTVSTVFAVVPVLRNVSAGFVIIITTILTAGVAAYFCPVLEEEA